MRRDDQLARLAAVPLFQGLSKRELRDIRRLAREVEFREGDDIVTEGMIGDDLYVILGGEVDVRVKGRRKATLRSGDYFGEIALIAKSRRTATVTATTRVWGLRLESRDFFSLLDNAPRVGRKVLVEVARRLAAAEPSPTS